MTSVYYILLVELKVTDSALSDHYVPSLNTNQVPKIY
jgi:hypothetical protein